MRVLCELKFLPTSMAHLSNQCFMSCYVPLVEESSGSNANQKRPRRSSRPAPLAGCSAMRKSLSCSPFQLEGASGFFLGGGGRSNHSAGGTANLTNAIMRSSILMHMQSIGVERSNIWLLNEKFYMPNKVLQGVSSTWKHRSFDMCRRMDSIFSKENLEPIHLSYVE